MRSTMQYESADTADSYSADKLGDAPAAAHSAPTHNTRATSSFAPSYSAATALEPDNPTEVGDRHC